MCFRGSNFHKVKGLTVEQLLLTESLYIVKNLDPKLWAEINKIKPELFEKPKP